MRFMRETGCWIGIALVGFGSLLAVPGILVIALGGYIGDRCENGVDTSAAR